MNVWSQVSHHPLVQVIVARSHRMRMFDTAHLISHLAALEEIGRYSIYINIYVATSVSINISWYVNTGAVWLSSCWCLGQQRFQNFAFDLNCLWHSAYIRHHRGLHLKTQKSKAGMGVGLHKQTNFQAIINLECLDLQTFSDCMLHNWWNTKKVCIYK